MQLIETVTRVTQVYRTSCPHCRSTVEHTKEATVTLTRNEQGDILELRIDCDWARKPGQDRT